MFDNVLTPEQRNAIWLMYLRKSQQDDPNETVEEVLERHERDLQELAMRELGREISEDCIYREVVSGESIANRTEIKKVLRRVEDSCVAGVLCVDPQRLSRGDLLDCGTLINILMYTKTLVATLRMTYDLSNKMHHRFFQDELMRGRDYLDYVREKLEDGKVRSVKRGNFIGSVPAYGYDKVKIGKDNTLVPNKDADVVRMIFDWYVNERIGYQKICDRLDDLGIKPALSDRWIKNTVAGMLRNVQYDGKVCYYRKKSVTIIRDGKRVSSRPLSAEEDMIIVEGKHPAIVDHETFVAAQRIINNNPRVKVDRELKNAFAGIVFCAHCGKALYYNKRGGERPPRLECRTKPHHFKSAKYNHIKEDVILALEQSELPNLKAVVKNNAGKQVSTQRMVLKRLEDEMQRYREQEEMQYELLETKQYSRELFEKRNATLRQKMSECEEKIKKISRSLPNAVNYEERIVSLRSAIKALKDDKLSPAKQNKLLKAIIEKIEVSTVDKGIGNTEINMRIFLKI